MDSTPSGKPHPWTKAIGVTIGVLVVVPAIVLSEMDAGPAHWLTKQQLKLFVDHYYPKLNFVALMLAEVLVLFIPLILIGITVRRLTGRTIAEWITGKRGKGDDARDQMQR